MKTLLFTLEYPPQKGGVANYYQNLVENWPDPEIEVLTVLENKNTSEAKKRVSGKKLLSSALRPKWLPAFWHLYREVKRSASSHILVGQILPLGTVAYYLAPILKFKYTVIIHGMDWTWALKKKRKKYLARRILERADKVICSNSYVADLVKRELKTDPDRVKVINPGISPVKYPEDNNFQKKLLNHYNPQKDILLLTVGRLVKRKGVDKVIESLPQIWQKNKNIKYFVAGTGPEEDYLRTKRKELGGQKDKVIFLGGINEAEKWNLLQLCDIFIMPAREIEGDFEGFGIVYLEANLMGKPVIAGQSGGVGDAVKHGINGLMVNPEDTGQIRDSVLELGENRDLREKLGEQGRKRAQNDFSWSQKIQELYSFLNT